MREIGLELSEMPNGGDEVKLQIERRLEANIRSHVLSSWQLTTKTSQLLDHAQGKANARNSFLYSDNMGDNLSHGRSTSHPSDSPHTIS